MNRFGRRAAALASALCLTWGAGVLPASANDGDIAATIGASGAATAQAAQSEQTTSVAQPEQQPELPQSVASDVPDDATLVSPDLAVLPDGTTKNVETGATVTDPALVGTADAPADPLDRTGGQSFVPMTVADAKSLASTAATADDHGNYWGSANGTKAFYQSNGQLFVQQAAKVIDVSKHNGTIDWQAVKDSGVDGAIIRIGYGAALSNLESQWDVQARRNISECKRLGIPFGVYLYSYADGSGMASDEGEYTARLLRYLGVSPSDLAYPVYYDLEQWSWTGHVTPTDPAVYEQIARAWYSKLEGAGYGAHLGIYSYTSYLNGPLNNAFIHDRTTWVAQYSGRLTYSGLTSNWRGWQYTSSGGVGGVSGDVDVSAFGYATYVDLDPAGESLAALGTRVTDLGVGPYFVISDATRQAMDVVGGGTQNEAVVGMWELNGNPDEQFTFEPYGDGSYAIRAVHSGKVLDASGGLTKNGTKLIQYDQTGASNQRWEVYAYGGQVYVQSVAAGGKNRVVDVPNGSADPGVDLQLWGANGGENQRFRLVPLSDYRAGAQGWVTIDGTAYWFNDGVLARSQEFYDPATGQWHWADADGTMARSKEVWVPDARKWVRYDANGAMIYGEYYDGSNWYSYDAVTGAMTHGIVHVDSNGGKWVYYDSVTGRMRYGETYVDYDAAHTGWYYFDPHTGAMAHGLLTLPDGRLVHYDDVSGQMSHGRAWVSEWQRYADFDAVTGRYLG